MSEATAGLVFAVIMVSGTIVWLAALAMTLQIGRKGDADEIERFTGSGAGNLVGLVRGEKTVHGEPERLSRAIVRALLQGTAGLHAGLFEVVERTAERVEIRKTGPLVVNQPGGLYFSEAIFDLEPSSGDTVRVAYSLGFARLARRMRGIALAILLGIGLPILLAVGGVIWLFVVSSPHDAVRWQVFQCLHIFHALWPPFLLIWLYSLGRRQSRAFVSNLVTSLEYED